MTSSSRTVVYRLQADVTQMRAQVAAAGASIKKLGDDATGATKQGAAFRQGLDTLGGTAAKVGLVAAAGLGVAIAKSADFEASMSKVSSATGASTAALDDLRQAALDAGAQTVFSATEAADGIEQLAKAGVSTEAILSGGLTGALDLAAAGELAVGDAAEIAAKAMTQFGLAGDQVPRIADLLASAAGNASGEVSDFGMALSQAGLVANQVGLSIEETTGGLAAFASAGLLGSDAGTSMKSALAALTPNSTKAAKAMDELGLSAFDSQGNFVGLAEFAGKLQTSLGDMTNEQRQATMETIFGSDAVRAASVLYEQGEEGIRGWIDTVDEQGAAAKMAGERVDNLRGDLEAFGGSLETALIGTGSSAQGPLRGLTQGLTDAVNAYNNLGDGAKSGVAVTLGATAALGGGLFVFSKMVQSVAATRLAMTQLGVTAKSTAAFMVGPWGLAMAGAGVVLYAFMEQQMKTAGYVDAFTSALDDQTGAMQRQAALAALRDDGWLDYAEELGLGLDIVTDAALGNADAMAKVKAAADAEGGGFFTINSDDFTKDSAQFVENVQAQADALAKAKENKRQDAEATKGLSSATEDLTAATSSYGGTLEDVTTAADDFKTTLESLNAALDGRATFRDYEAALDDFTKSLKENGNTFDINTAKGRANQSALDNIAGSALNLAATMSETDRQKFLTGAIGDLRRMGENMGLPKSEVNALIALLRQANTTNVNPKIDADAAPAFATFRSVDQYMSNIDGRVATTYIDTVTRRLGQSPETRAAGGYVAGRGPGDLPDILTEHEKEEVAA